PAAASAQSPGKALRCLSGWGSHRRIVLRSLPKNLRDIRHMTQTSLSKTEVPAARGAKKFLETPPAIETMPPGIPYIVGNEAAERFSFYGMRGILVVFMTTFLLGRDGSPAPMSEAEAKEYFHYFVSAVYFFPIVGAILSDSVLGKYRTILLLSIVYCL